MAVFGLFLAFFGSTYLVTLAAIEAYRLCGWEQSYKYLVIIWEDYQVFVIFSVSNSFLFERNNCLFVVENRLVCAKTVRQASLKDDQVDDNKDGIADVKQISKKELVSRKSMLFLKVCSVSVCSCLARLPGFIVSADAAFACSHARLTN
jgi:hypothetical protein